MMVAMSAREFAQTMGEITLARDSNMTDDTKAALRAVILRFRDEYIQGLGFDEAEFYMMCDPRNRLELPI